MASYETIRRWSLTFGPLFAAEIRRRRLLELAGTTDSLEVTPEVGACTLYPYVLATLRLDQSGQWRVSDGRET
ncbi:MAG TPA: hypothetical protein VNL71_13545 [Chloroflexota bacterium]|nr:hypothetical protein [Chloroflexota bacterium]